MSYPHQQQVHQWLEEMHRWSPPGMGGGGQWSAAIESSGYRVAPVPIMGGEAADTQEALKRMDQKERVALEVFHVGRGHFTAKAAQLGMSKRTLHRRLHDAHQHFWEIRCAYVADLVAASKANREAAAGSKTARRTSTGAALSIRVGKPVAP